MYIPQVERSHRTWKAFLLYDLMDGFEQFMSNQVRKNFDWVTALPVYQHIYNTTVHSALGNVCVCQLSEGSYKNVLNDQHSYY